MHAPHEVENCHSCSLLTSAKPIGPTDAPKQSMYNKSCKIFYSQGEATSHSMRLEAWWPFEGSSLDLASIFLEASSAQVVSWPLERLRIRNPSWPCCWPRRTLFKMLLNLISGDHRSCLGSTEALRHIECVVRRINR